MLIEQRLVSRKTPLDGRLEISAAAAAQLPECSLRLIGIAEAQMRELTGADGCGSALLRRRRRRKSRARSFRRIRRQCELGHSQQFAFDVEQRQIHLPLGIRENTVAEHALDQPFALRLRVAALDADQRKDAAPDAADDTSINLDMRLGYALNKCDQAGMSGTRRILNRAMESLRMSLRFLRRRS